MGYGDKLKEGTLWQRNCAVAINNLQTAVATKGARVYNNANISVNDSTLTKLTFNEERWDDETIHDTGSNTSRLTCVTAGTYLISGNVSFALNTAGFRLARILLNNTTVIGSVTVQAVQTDVTIVNVSTVYPLVAGDYVELQVYQTSGGALNALASANYSPEFMIARL